MIKSYFLTVGDLIEQLSKYPKEMAVAVGNPDIENPLPAVCTFPVRAVTSKLYPGYEVITKRQLKQYEHDSKNKELLGMTKNEYLNLIEKLKSDKSIDILIVSNGNNSSEFLTVSD